MVQSSLESYPFFKIPVLSTFYKHCCKCLCNSSIDSCVDITKSTLFHYMRALNKYIQNNIELKYQLTNCNCSLHEKPTNEQFTTYLNGRVKSFIYHCYCERKEFKDLECTDYIPKFIQFLCSNSICNECGRDKLNLLSCPILNQYQYLLSVNEWHLATR